MTLQRTSSPAKLLETTDSRIRNLYTNQYRQSSGEDISTPRMTAPSKSFSSVWKILLVVLVLVWLYLATDLESDNESSHSFESDSSFDFNDAMESVRNAFETAEKGPRPKMFISYCADDITTTRAELNDTFSRIGGLDVYDANSLNEALTYDGMLKCVPSSCPSHTITDSPPPEVSSKMRRVAGLQGGLYLNDKSNLCAFGANAKTPTSPDHVVPPCFTVDEWQSGKIPKDYLERFPVWIFKPSKSSSGAGIRFVRSNDTFERTDGMVQAYVHNPLLYKMQIPGQEAHMVKSDLRIYGTVTSLTPLRIYISRFGYFRTGDPRYEYHIPENLEDMESKYRFVHITNNSPKKGLGVWRNNTDLFESEPASIGSLQRYLSFIVPNNGLDADKVWKSIVNLHVRLFTNSAKVLRSKASVSDKGRKFLTFSTDVAVDETGRAWLYEVHGGCSLKPRGYGDVEAGYEKVATMSSRQGTWGSMWMGFAPLFQPRVKVAAELWIQESMERFHLEKCTGSGGDGSCLTDDDCSELSMAAQEYYQSCSVSQVPVLPTVWRTYRDLLTHHDIMFYKLWDLFEMEKMLQHLRGAGSCPNLVI